MTAQVNFAKGEVSPEIYARFDVAAYSSGARQARNVRVMKYGGLAKRMGTRFVAEVADATRPVRLVPFQFSFEQAYALEFGHGYMRPAALGGMVLEDELVITGITSAAQAVVAAAYHGYVVGDRVFLSGGAGGMGDLLNGLVWQVTAVPDAGHFAINANTIGVAFSGWSGGTARSSAPTPTPTPPPVSTPTPEPEAPTTGGGGGSGSGADGGDGPPFIGGNYCVAADSTFIRMAAANGFGPGGEKLARDLRGGDFVWTMHERTGEWGAYRVAAVSFVEEFVLSCGDLPRATPDHRFWLDGRWRQAREVGMLDGRALVMKATVDGAHTYLSRDAGSQRWVVSHNVKTIGS